MIDEHLRIQGLPLSVGQFIALGFGIPEHHGATARSRALEEVLGLHLLGTGRDFGHRLAAGGAFGFGGFSFGRFGLRG